MSKTWWQKTTFLSAALALLMAPVRPVINNFDFHTMKNPLFKIKKPDISSHPFFSKSNPKQDLFFWDQLEKQCPEEIFPIFDLNNSRWKGLFAKNCKTMISYPEMEGKFGQIYENPKDEQTLEYGFFKGTINADKLIVIASGAFFDKQFSLPYVVLLNKVLGYSCVIGDYRGHENSWDENSKKNPMYRLHKGSSGVDSSKFTFGLKEGQDFYDMVDKVCKKNPYIKEKFGLGICFGGAVVARAQNISLAKTKKPLFKAIALISPLPGVHELIENLASNSNGLKLFAGKIDQKKLKSKLGLKVAGFMAGKPFLSKLLTNIVCQKLKLRKVDSIPEYAKIKVPTLMIASRDSDDIVTMPMALKVWNAIGTDKKFMLWSSGVGHLFNWRHETAQLGQTLSSFFNEPDQFISAPLKSLE